MKGFYIDNNHWNGISLNELRLVDPDSTPLQIRWRICWYEYGYKIIWHHSLCKLIDKKHIGDPAFAHCWEEKLVLELKCLDDPLWANAYSWASRGQGFPITFRMPAPPDGGNTSRGGTDKYDTYFDDPILRHRLKSDIINCEIETDENSLYSSMYKYSGNEWKNQFKNAICLYLNSLKSSSPISINDAFNIPFTGNSCKFQSTNFHDTQKIDEIIEGIYKKMASSWKICDSQYGSTRGGNDDPNTNSALCECLKNGYSKQNALEDIFKKYYGLTDEEYECSKDSKEMMEKIQELKKLSIIDPCDKGKTSTELISSLLQKVCNSSGNKLQDFLNELDKTDWIQFYNNFNNNKRLKCLFNKIIDNNLNLYCKTLVNFEGVSSISLRFDYQSFKNSDGSNDISRSATTSIDNQGHVLIQLNSNLIENACNWNVIQTILHEGIHANINKIFFDYTITEIKLKFPKLYYYYTTYKNSIWNWSHEYMANESVIDLIVSLKQIYGLEYTDDEYLAMAWDGLQNTNHWINDKSDSYKSKINNLLNKNNSNCDKKCD